MKFSVSNLWTELGTTVTAVIAILGAIGPFVVGQKMPANGADWVMLLAGAGMAIVKAFGK